jgi:phosphoribosylformylglycinamidine cyclo-ligase
LDYIATGRLEAEKVAQIVKGIADGCVMAKCALIGGETAEMPDFYSDGEYDIAGFAVGVVDKSNVITGEKIKEGDIIIGLASSGLHSNGYSLARKVFFDKLGLGVNDYIEEFKMTVGEMLLTPTKIYADACEAVLAKHEVNGIVHITGGGFFENVPRVLPDGLCAKFSDGMGLSAFRALPPFSYIQKHGNIDEVEMYKTFNMGVGMMMFVNPQIADDVRQTLNAIGQPNNIIGEVVKGDGIILDTL